MWVCLLTWDCLLHYNFHNMAYNKMFNLVKWGVELKMNWLNWSIPISSGFQFQFNCNSKSFNSIPIQFMLNWIELIIKSPGHLYPTRADIATLFQTLVTGSHQNLERKKVHVPVSKHYSFLALPGSHQYCSRRDGSKISTHKEHEYME